MLSTITLNAPARCHKCNALLNAGRRARIGYGRIYCPNNKHNGALTKAEAASQRVSRNIAEGTINFQHAHGQITTEQRDAQLAKLRS
jgi:phage FluMu protein Com